MSNIFTLENFSDFTEKINIDELYEKKRNYDLNKLELFKKILNRVHIRIKTTAKLTKNEKFCWFIVPETIIGVPKYDQAGCIAYIMDSLEKNGFAVRYFHPNAIFISWNHWVPTYIRDEIKKKTGLIVNEYGKVIEDKEKDDEIQEEQPELEQIKNSKKYTPINSYKPSGNLVYSQDLLSKIENKFKDE
jgi:hypothetical protein